MAGFSMPFADSTTVRTGSVERLPSPSTSWSETAREPDSFTRSTIVRSRRVKPGLPRTSRSNV